MAPSSYSRRGHEVRGELVLERLPQRGGYVALAIVANDCNDGLAGVLWATSNLVGCVEDRTGGDTSEDALFRSQATRGSQ